MGYGLPAALGAQIAAPGHRVILVAGDGGFKMTGMELYTIAAYNLPVIAVILDNGCLGMVRQWQQLFYRGRYSASLAPREMDFTALAAVCGIPGRRALPRPSSRRRSPPPGSPAARPFSSPK
jgi:acetolactate synthase-1/2/3 large subunit